jgi:hypothetical protein
LPFQHFETGQSNPSKGNFSYNNNVGYRVLLRNWQLSGKNYIYYRPQALPSNPAGITVPERGLTLRQAWDKYSMSVDGGPVPDDAVPLANSDGYVLEYSGEVPLLELPASKWILVYPNASTAYPVSSRKLTMIYTGAPADINRQIEIDGQLLTLTTQQLRSLSPSQFQLPNNGNWNQPGWHTMKTWRTNNGQLVDGSTMEFSYYIGDEPIAMIP